MTIPFYEAWPKNDRLQRWMVIDIVSPGRGKQIIADNIRSKAMAELIAKALNDHINENPGFRSGVNPKPQ